jgi:parvulin-like peptidyl-prolyl isomerase
MRRHVFALVILATMIDPPPPLRADDGGAIVVMVGDTPIVRAELDAALRAGGFDRLASPERAVQAQATVLERLVDERLLAAVVARDGISVPAAEVEAAIGQAREQVAAQGGQFADFLARTGRDEAGFRRSVELELAARKLVEPRATAAALKAFVAARRREHDGTMLRASHVLLRPDVGSGDEPVARCLERADRIRRDILAGDISFATAAQMYSAAPSRHRGGDVGFLPRNGIANEEFSRQLFALVKGEVSRPFATPFGVHLLTVTAVEPGRERDATLEERLRPLFLTKLIRDVVLEQRGLRRIEYAAGVPHFDPATPEGGPQPRRIIVKAADTP